MGGLSHEACGTAGLVLFCNDEYGLWGMQWDGALAANRHVSVVDPPKKPNMIPSSWPVFLVSYVSSIV